MSNTRQWLELESDPGLFTLLVEDFGVNGVQVEEIYDLQKSIEGTVYGFIFLFKWIEERRARKKTTGPTNEMFVTDDDVVNKMFFAQQLIPNSCATHALLHVLLNCEQVDLGSLLTQLKKFSEGFNPESKGYAIGNCPELARAHNSHAKPEPKQLPEKQTGISTGRTMEAFHFNSFIPIRGRLFELDGLKPHPIDHGPVDDATPWTEKFRQVITERLGIATAGEPYHDIRFNLMAVVPDKIQMYERKLNNLKTNRQIVLDCVHKLLKMSQPNFQVLSKSQTLAALKNLSPMARIAFSMRPVTPTSTPLPTTSACNNIATGSVPSMTTTTHSVMTRRASATRSSTRQEVGQGAAGGVDTLNVPALRYQRQPTKRYPCRNRRKRFLLDSASLRGATATPAASKPAPLDPPPEQPADMSTPLSIQTDFAENHGSMVTLSNESTDTSSEMGSDFNSPTHSLQPSADNSPDTNSLIFRARLLTEATSRLNEELKKNKEPALIMTDSLKQNNESASLPQSTDETKTAMSADTSQLNDSAGAEGTDAAPVTIKVEPCQDPTAEGQSEVPVKPPGVVSPPQSLQMKALGPTDLLHLLKNVECEIENCEAVLKDEIEKRNKYKIDDCRRTHNYDPFIRTFLSMLAEQNHLQDLVEQHMMVRKRQGVSIGRLHKLRKQDNKKKRTARPPATTAQSSVNSQKKSKRKKT